MVNDLDVDFTENVAASDRYKHDIRNIRKVKEMTAKLKVNLITPLRPGKKLLVLDIDYSGLTSKVLPGSPLTVPYSHPRYQALDLWKFTSERMRKTVLARVLGSCVPVLR